MSIQQIDLFAMNNNLLYEDEADRQRHRRFIEATAEELQRSVEEVTQFYEEALVAMAAEARVRDYLPIFVSKNVKRSLNHLPRAK
ncbi:MAG: DUF3562 domain-containing protein [Burkholderiales bacterium]|nr:DUF3562 domain-containing protein [Burkholderiales bacterium]